MDIYSKVNFNYSDPDYEPYKYRLAELWFRNADDEIYSTLKVQTILDLISKVAGLPNLMLIIFGLMLGKFQQFYSNIEMYIDIIDNDEKGHE